ncbi:SufS family cysteine desulfurase [Thalassotalea piscium]|uniref:cysteine desulfurase n=1 Tax=Thalassotalea piscium TaxID=1230533 RepID=A0A7X0TTT9_9GAMM|nr:SufS family cysteine desulfurase [Thalassotalea piscium]MBB6543617.1 SufS family cysteine desulfurase [Thalassotalea piscium]
MKNFEIKQFRQQFPILKTNVNHHPLIYLDNGATTQKPQCVINEQNDVYCLSNANVHRASYQLAAEATAKFEQARITVQQFINASKSSEIIWTKSCTESINLVAHSWGSNQLNKGDVIVLSYGEHHANIVPWQIVAEKTGAVIKVLPLNKQGTIAIESLVDIICEKTKIVCVSHISNVIGKINPINKIIARAKSVGALTLIDGAQAVANISVDVQALDCDFYVFSAHKMYGPTGVGVLFGKAHLLDSMPPYQAGGEMIEHVSFSGTSYQPLPFKFEAGTPNISGVIAFSRAIEFINEYQLTNTHEYKKTLLNYAFERLSSVPTLKFIVEGKPDIALFSFTLAENLQDVASQLDLFGISVRVGRHCAMPLFEFLNINGCIRLSLAPYNTLSEVDVVVDKLTYLSNIKDSAVKQAQDNAGVQEIISTFRQLKGWDTKHRELMLLGKKLPRMPKSKRSDSTLIQGCESAAWLTYSKDINHLYYFQTDSDAKIIRGLLAVVLLAFNGKSAAEILNFDINNYFSQLGLLKHLSPSRGNGLLAIVDKIKSIVS